MHPAQDEDVIVDCDTVLSEQRQYRMIGGQFEGRRHLPLIDTAADERGIAPRADGQRECIQQDGLSGASLAGQRAEP